jgi:Ni2+-binding GTPase involved in maturation of urease and hydrogenase
MLAMVLAMAIHKAVVAGKAAIIAKVVRHAKRSVKTANVAGKI